MVPTEVLSGAVAVFADTSSQAEYLLNELVTRESIEFSVWSRHETSVARSWRGQRRRGRLESVTDARRKLAARLRGLEGVVESPSAFGAGEAFWCNGTEIAHFDSADVVDLRLTRSVIGELRPVLRADVRVQLRKSSSDWIEVRFLSNDDIAFVVELAERAAAAHRAGTGETPRPPPVGADLERRRRFH